MGEILDTLARLSVLVFVIVSMGLSLKMAQIIAPLKNTKLVVLALVASLNLTPVLAVIISPSPIR